MKTVGKALLWSIFLVVAFIAIPLLVLVCGIALPVVLTIAAFIFVPLLVGMILGKNSKD